MSELPEAFRNAVTFAFGDTPKLADDLLALVLSGKRRQHAVLCGTLARKATLCPSSDVVMSFWMVRVVQQR